VISKVHARFWAAFAALPKSVQELARDKFNIWRREPFHPSLHFKHLKRGVWSVRINQDYRALGLRDEQRIIWFWIGSHDEYDRRIARL
jgi:hypothetical protein